MQTSNESLTPDTPFSLTDAAAARIAYLLSDEPPGTHFWIGVDGGGCSGFQYRFDLSARAPESSDHIITHGKASVAIDDISLGLLKNSVLNYAEDMSSAGFEIKNPNATAKCGCGNSFSVAF